MNIQFTPPPSAKWKLAYQGSGTGTLSAQTYTNNEFEEICVAIEFTTKWATQLVINIPYIHLTETNKRFSVGDNMFIGWAQSNYYGGHADIFLNKTQIMLSNVRNAFEGMQSDAPFNVFVYIK